MLNFFHNYIPQPILFHLGPLFIHWYGFLMVLGGLFGLFLVLRLAKNYDIKAEVIEDLCLYFVVGAVVMARIYYFFYAWELYRDNPLSILKIWEGGLAVHGIMIGGFLALLLFSKIKNLSFLLLADLSVVGLCAAQIIGRNGNYFNQELFGLPTSLPWGIAIDLVHRPIQYFSNSFFHPVFLYEVLGNIIILSVLLFLHRRRNKTKKFTAGNIFLVYLLLYSIMRFGLEFLRVDFSPLVFGIRWAQVVSGVVILIAGGLLINLNVRTTRLR